MKFEIYKNIVFNSSFGYSYNELIFDENGNAVDFVFLEVNDPFKKITGIKNKNIIGKTYFELFPTLKNKNIDWLNKYSEVALNGGSKEFEQYSTTLDRWYKIKAFSDRRNYFVTVVFDLTDEMRVAHYAEEFLQLGKKEIDYQKFTDDLFKITNAAVVTFNCINDKTHVTKTLAITGVGKLVEKSRKIFNFEFLNKTWLLNDDRFKLLKSNSKIIFKSLSDFMRGNLNDALLKIIKKTRFNNPVHLYAIKVNNRIIGDFVLLTRKNGVLKNESLVELYAQLVGLQISRREIENQYQKSNENLNLVLEATENGYWDRNFVKDTIYFNDKYFTMLGYGPNELPHSTSIWKELMHPDDRELIAPKISEQIKLGNSYEMNFRLKCKDGRWKWIMGKGKGFMFDKKGQPQRAVGIHLDIDIIKKTEEKLIASENHFKALFEYSPTPMWEEDFSVVKKYIDDLKEKGISDIDRYFTENPMEVKKCFQMIKVLDLNNAAVKLHNTHSKEELLENYLKFIPDSALPKIAKELVAIANHKSYCNFDMKSSTIDGHTIYLQIFWKVVPGYEPDYSKVFVSTVEITDRVLNMIKIKENEERLKSINDAIPDMIFELDSKGYFTFYNSSIGDKSYYTKNFVGRKVENVLPPELTAITLIKIKQTLSENKIQSYEYSLEIKGEEQFFEARMVPKGDNHVLAVVRNITERKKLESEKKHLEDQRTRSQNLETIGTLAGGIAHDFNNMLTPIMGYSDMIKSEMNENHPHYDSMNEIYMASQRAKELVVQMLSFSKEVEQDKAPIIVSSVLKEAVKLARASIPESIDVKIQIYDEKCRILGDAIKIHQIIMNLVTNAFHAMEDGKGTLTICQKRITIDENEYLKHMDIPSGDYLKLIVKDTGHGMDKNTLERIFEPFFTTKEQGKGTGMGLSVVHGIVKSHNGAIHVDSELGIGTEFTICFPIVEFTDEEEKHNHIPLQHGTENIMVVDDREYITKMLQNMLSDFGYNIFTFNNSVEAWESYKHQPQQFDLVITDRNMPEMTGLELAKNIKNYKYQVPVLLITGQGHNLSKEMLTNFGITKLINKPIKLQDMVTSISVILKK